MRRKGRTNTVSQAGTGFGSRILDFDFNVTTGWYGVDLDPAATSRWAVDLSQDVVGDSGDADERTELRGELQGVRDRLVTIGDPYMRAAVLIPAGERARVRCVLAFRITEPDYGADPVRYEQELAADAGHVQPGERFDIVKTWNVPVNAGLAVGAYDLITYTDPGAEYGRTEGRTVIGVFPSGSSQIIEFVFTTAEPASFSDLVDVSMACVATLTVTLEKENDADA